MTRPSKRPANRRHRRSIAILVAAGALVFAGLQPAFASHPEVSLPGSQFEIDTDANLKLDDPAPSLDWASVTETRKADKPSGGGDDSFGQGSSEDTAVPSVVDGSIPPNKSDLLTFGTYLENAGGTKFLHLFWHRVQEPSGTTNMDFEFNQSSTVSSNGVTPVRTQGDLLIQYDLSQGGTNPTLWLSTWETADKNKCESASKVPCWGAKQNLTAAGTATGSINTSAIPSGSSDGLGSISPRTFGEATINFSRQVPPGTCTSFGSAYLKSRSSDSFTSALKDFIAPMSVSISNCGGVKIVKTDDAGNPLAGAEFTLYKNAAPTTAPRGAEDVITSPVKKCTTDAQGVCTMTGVLIGDYWAVESVVPAGHIGSADVAVSVTGEQTVTVNVVNQRQRGAIEIVKTAKHFDATSAPNLQATFTISRGGTAVAEVQTDATTGKACVPNLLFGDYTVDETAGQAGYALDPAVKGVTVDKVADCASGEKASVSFENKPLSNIGITFTSQVPGGTAASIVCKAGSSVLDATPADGTPNPATFDDTAESYTGLIEGTYVCTVVIDP